MAVTSIAPHVAPAEIGVKSSDEAAAPQRDTGSSLIALFSSSGELEEIGATFQHVIGAQNAIAVLRDDLAQG